MRRRGLAGRADHAVWPRQALRRKARCWRLARNTSMHVVNLRLAMVYGHGGRGNLERMARGIRAGWFPPLPDSGNRRSLVHVEDVVAAMGMVAQAPAANGRTYIVADPKAYSGREIYDAIRRGLGNRPRAGGCRQPFCALADGWAMARENSPAGHCP
ncbi:MAG: NAD-dependent epimerase/dehydratase family protein [Rhodocyclaceae bacterium]|nr:NAD-dependent epimerase/dehydratase family protein [Rhodocyclaceae bacterium]